MINDDSYQIPTEEEYVHGDNDKYIDFDDNNDNNNNNNNNEFNLTPTSLFFKFAPKLYSSQRL